MVKQEAAHQDCAPAIKHDQLVNVVPKVWGREEWIVNNKHYCGKKLVFNAGYRCSMHHHKIKDETFYVQSGTVLLEIENNETQESRTMTPGDTAHIAPLTWHRLTALTDAQVFEFSTFHMEEDSYRKVLAGKADLTLCHYV